MTSVESEVASFHLFFQRKKKRKLRLDALFILTLVLVARSASCIHASRVTYVLSRIQLFAIPWTITHQAPLSMGFPRLEYWSGLPFPSPGHLPDSGIRPMSPALTDVWVLYHGATLEAHNQPQPLLNCSKDWALHQVSTVKGQGERHWGRINWGQAYREVGEWPLRSSWAQGCLRWVKLIFKTETNSQT